MGCAATAGQVGQVTGEADHFFRHINAVGIYRELSGRVVWSISSLQLLT